MSEANAPEDLPVIAIGASAGGLEACRALLKDMPADMPAAFVLILHLDPTHDSMMVDLLAGHTGLKVVQASEGLALRPGYLHVIPPGAFLTVSRRVLHLSGPGDGKGVRLPFDVLLRSLARDGAATSGCIVLSGTGTDGSLGIAEIHAAGGLVIAQDPSEATFSGMPESAIGTGFVAQILRTDEMVGALERFLGAAPAHPAPTPGKAQGGDDTARRADDPDTDDYGDLLAFVGEHSPQDISLYKRGTLERRIGRRMSLVGLAPDETARYLGILKSDPEECAHLTSDLLIHVTSFFRDPAVFEHLSAKAVPSLLAALPADRPLRVWVAGCSTGEEAYSLAIICLEAIEAAGSGARLQILASDVDPEAIATARAGFYPKDIATVVSPERLTRFFVPEEGGWRVTPVLRDVIVFTVADLLSDPPFSRIDLVSCRNVLIYLGPEAQKRVIARCCFALRPGGLLLLGTAEMPGQSDGCFVVEDKNARLWRRVGHSHPGDLHFAIGKREEALSSPSPTPARRTRLADLCRRIILENYAPAAVLMNSRFDCLYLLGPTERYLKIIQGHPDPGVVGMLPKALRTRFRAAAASCTPSNPVVTVSGGRTSEDTRFDIALHSVSDGTEPLLLACFLDTRRPGHADPEASSGEGQPGERSVDHETDVEALRRDRDDALRDLEREVEAHRADAAEALSVNEEFQSTNEELLASKEELQSLNEELTALNSQLQETLERHRTTANDLQNVLYSSDVATLFLDLDLNIRFFTPAARAIFRVIPSDVGRPLADLSAVAGDDHLTEDARAVLASSHPVEREIPGAGGLWFMRRIQPYRAGDGRVEGVVITYLDITEHKRINAALAAAMEEADRATKAKSRFLAAASHDLRQPLQSMALLHKLLAPHRRSSEGARLVKLLDQTLNSMTEMLDSMLDVNRIESGIVRPDMQPMAIAPLMQRLAEEFGPLCRLKGLKLRWVPCSAWVQTDPPLLEQMLRNLLSNAVKYTLQGGILMGCRRRGPRLTMLVCDTGIGVSDSEAKAIFEAYRQGERASALSSGGLGLGLSIVQRLADLMDHPIAVRSTPGKGSTFMITLPLVEAPPDNHDLPGTAPAPKQTGTILVVEDEEPMRDLLASVLTKAGHTVIATADAPDALAWASHDDAWPDLLLTDFDLHGGTDGLKLAHDLTKVLGVRVPTIILTGDISSETMARIAASPCRQVAKPAMPEVLLAQISDLMLKDRAERASAARRSETSGTTVHVVDDDPMIRGTMRRLFEAEGWRVVTYASAEDFLAAPRPEDAACLLVDSRLPGMDGVTLLKLLQDENSPLPGIVLTGHGDAATAVAAMKAGASDLIEKPASAADLLASVRHAIETGRDGRARAESRKAAQRRFSDLTPRERDVLERMLAGQPNKNIAFDLGINQRTVENHRAAVMRKTGAASLPALVRLSLAAAS